MQRTRWLLAASAAGMVMLVPAPASADLYSVFSCRDPLGPVNEAIGWVGTKSGTGQVANGCAAGGALTAVLPQPRPEGDASASWTFAAPPGTKIVRFHARRTTAGLTKSLLASDLAYIVETDTATLEKCAPSTESSCIADLSAPVQKEGLNGAWVRIRAICTNAGDVCSSPLRVDTSQVNIGLQDLFAPKVANVKVLDDGDQSGKLAVGFDAADIGGGLYRMIVKVDGKVSSVVSAGGKCADALATDADPYQFAVPVPCPLATTGARGEVNVRALTPGPHGVELAIEDAAGNQTAVYGPTEFPRANGENASTKANLKMWFAKGLRRLGSEAHEPPRPAGRHARHPAQRARRRHPGRADRRLPRAQGQAEAAEDGPEDARARRADADPAQRRRHALDRVRLPRRASRPGDQPLDAAPERPQAQRQAVLPPLSASGTLTPDIGVKVPRTRSEAGRDRG